MITSETTIVTFNDAADQSDILFSTPAEEILKTIGFVSFIQQVSTCVALYMQGDALLMNFLAYTGITMDAYKQWTGFVGVTEENDGLIFGTPGRIPAPAAQIGLIKSIQSPCKM